MLAEGVTRETEEVRSMASGLTSAFESGLTWMPASAASGASGML